MKILTLTCLVVAFRFTSVAQSLEAQQTLSNIDVQFFIENNGQWPDEVLYLTRLGGLDVWITRQGVNYTFYRIEEDPGMNPKKEGEPGPGGKFDGEAIESTTLLGHRVILDLLGSSDNPGSEGIQIQTAYYNYFIGNDDRRHASNVGLYKEAIIKEVYKGIDVRYYFVNGNLRYDYIVKPGADPTQIQFRLHGQYEDYLKEQDLAFTTRFGEASLGELFTYQDGKAIESWFVKENNSWQIALGKYDHDQTLIIDPLIYSTYIGGSSNDHVSGICIDNSGNAYVTGNTTSINFDVTAGAFQISYGGGVFDVFVTKLNATGTAVLYSTYIGGSAEDVGHAISVDSNGNAYVTGRTLSINYALTTGVFQTSNGGANDVFVTKINATGTALLYSTYIGGSDNEHGLGISVDGSGNAYITGGTSSTNYDVTTGVIQTSNGGANDVFVTKLNATGTALLYSTYIGGSGDDFGYGISVNSTGNAFMTGQTKSTNYDVTIGAFQSSNGGNDDVIVTKLNATGTALLYSTYIGGSGFDYGRAISVDSNENVYLTGWTTSTNYDVTTGAFQTSFGGNTDVFVTKLNATGTALLYSTYIGVGGAENGRAISLDISGNAYVTGNTTSTNFTVTTGAYQTVNGGGWDVFVTKLNSTGTALLYSTYIGGSGDDFGYGISVNSNGNAFVTGQTTSTNYDVTTGVFQTSNGGAYDVFITKLDFCASTFDSTSVTACNSYTWATTSLNYTASGTYNDTLSNAAGCDSVVTLNLTINNSNSGSETIAACNSYTWAANSLTYTASGVYTDTLSNAVGCDSVITLNLTINNSNSGSESLGACNSYTWAANSLTYTASGVYTDTLTNAAGCDSVVTLNLTINTADVSVTNTSPTLTANATGAAYQWLDCNAGMAVISGETNQTFTATANGSYAVEVSQNGCTDTSACVPVLNVGVVENSFDNLHSAYPNPTSGVVNIELNNFYNSVTIVIRNELGQEVKQMTFSNASKFQLDIPGQNGVYFIEVKTGDKKAILKVIKE